MSRSLRRVAAACLAAFGLLALVLGYWSIGAPGLIARDDNPRRVFVEQRIQRGTIVDRRDRVLAESIVLSGTFVRRYPAIETAPAVGYYSLNYGQAGLEKALDATLRGPYDFADELLQRPRIGGDGRVTIDLDVQHDLAQRLTQAGAAVILSIPDGDILAMASQPAYDPNTLDQNWKRLSTDPSAPLLNRVTQGLYQPGAILQTALLADAIDHERMALTQTVSHPDQPVALDNLVLVCAQAGAMQTLADAYANGCPAPFADLGVALGETELVSITQRWHLTTPPQLSISTSAAPTLTMALSTTEALQAFATGQGELTVSPLHMAMVAATIGNSGQWPALRLIGATRRAGEQWLPYPAPLPVANRVISANTARAILGAMRTIDNVAGHSGTAFSGNKQLAWFIGLAPTDRPRYAIAVLIELPKDEPTREAEEIGRAVLGELLQQP